MRRALALMALTAPGAASAHQGHGHGDALPWTFDPEITLPLAAALALGLVGYLRLRRRSSRGRDLLDRRAGMFVLGWFVLAAALVSPLHAAGERSFTAHMIEHETIMLVAALFLGMSSAGPLLLWGLPGTARKALAALLRNRAVEGGWRLATGAGFATALQAAALWTWHAPPLFGRALASEGWHAAQHLSFFLSALLFWLAMARALREHAEGLAAICLVATATLGAGLGALMTLSSSPWYPGYAALGMTPFGLTPVQDQQLAGVVMWIPGGLVHLGAALLIVRRWLERPGPTHAVAA